MIRLSLISSVLITSMSSHALAQSTYLESRATVFGDSDSTPRIVPPAQAATAAASFSGVENVPGSTSTNAINASADTRTEYGFGSVSGFTSNQLMPVGSRFVSAFTQSNSVSTSADRLVFSWDEGFDESQLINVEFILEVVLPKADPMNKGFVFDSRTGFRLESGMNITPVSGHVVPDFNRVTINQTHLSFTPGIRSDSVVVSMSHDATVSLNSSLLVNVDAAVSANTGNPDLDVLSNQIGISSFYRVFVVIPDGVSITSESSHDYEPSICIADLTGDGNVDFFDVSAFLSAFNSQEPIADLTGDGMFDFFDVSAFLQAFNEGCP